MDELLELIGTEIVAAIVGGALVWLVSWLNWAKPLKAECATLRQELAELREPVKLPVKAQLRHRFHAGWYTKYPGTSRAVDVLIPEVWIEYEDGSTKPLELEGLHQGAHGIDIYPLGPITFGRPDEGQ